MKPSNGGFVKCKDDTLVAENVDLGVYWDLRSIYHNKTKNDQNKGIIRLTKDWL
jgi:hypothetical protein